jgi:hypothetical protein
MINRRKNLTSQIENHMHHLKDVKKKIQKLCLVLDTRNLKIHDMCSQNTSREASGAKSLPIALVKLKSLQQKFKFQTCIFLAFKVLM